MQPRRGSIWPLPARREGKGHTATGAQAAGGSRAGLGTPQAAALPEKQPLRLQPDQGHMST